jgi:glucokinase
MNSQRLVVGLDLGGTKILSVLVDESLNVLAQDLRPTEASDGPEAVIARMAASARSIAAGRELSAVGISTPGPSDPSRGVVTTPPNLPGWRDVPLARLIQEQLGVPAWIENDANAAAIAEHRLGAGREAQHVILVTTGTGIGGGLILDGRLYEGASGAAGEIGHMQLEPQGPLCGCGRHGCLEALASGRALAERAKEIASREPRGILALLSEDGTEIDARLIEKAADLGDASAEAAIQAAGRYLGVGLCNLVNIFNPEVIVIGGSLRKLGVRYLGPAREAVKQAFPQSYADVRIVEAELGDEAPAIGAALIALERLDHALPS